MFFYWEIYILVSFPIGSLPFMMLSLLGKDHSCWTCTSRWNLKGTTSITYAKCWISKSLTPTPNCLLKFILIRATLTLHIVQPWIHGLLKFTRLPKNPKMTESTIKFKKLKYQQIHYILYNKVAIYGETVINFNVQPHSVGLLNKAMHKKFLLFSTRTKEKDKNSPYYKIKRFRSRESYMPCSRWSVNGQCFTSDASPT